MRDLFEEISASVGRNKLRTCLTGFAVSWGIFMLIVLLGAGQGLQNAFMRDGARFATNTIQIGGGYTSKPYDGLKEGRRIILDQRDVDLTAGSAFSDYVDDVIATVSTSAVLSLGKKYVSGTLEGNYPERQAMDKIEILHGRFINKKDIEGNRKVLVIPERAAESLVDDKKDIPSLVGERVKVGGTFWRIVGITKSGDMDDENLFYGPFTTVKIVYSKGKEIDEITFSFHGLETEEANEAFEEAYRAVINRAHRAAPDDNATYWTWNRFTQNLQMQKGTSILNTALWIVGLFTLLGGIVGVSNIMLITVKERTHEIGIRKAIGARPWDITKLVISESVCITAFFGYVGMILGMGVCEILDKTLGHAKVSVIGQEVSMLSDPTVDVSVAIEATIVLIVAGTIAGLFPAVKASKVRPIEALRAD